MGKNGQPIKKKKVSAKTIREMLEVQRIGNRAVHQAQEKNRQQGIPNWYVINGVLINDQEIRGSE